MQWRVDYQDMGTRTAVAFNSSQGTGSVTRVTGKRHRADSTVAVDEDPTAAGDNSSRITTHAWRSSWWAAASSIKCAGSGPSAIHSRTTQITCRPPALC